MMVRLRWPRKEVTERDAEPSKRRKRLYIERITCAKGSHWGAILALLPDIDTFRGWPDNPDQLRSCQLPLLCLFRHLWAILRWRGHFNDKIGYETPVTTEHRIIRFRQTVARQTWHRGPARYLGRQRGSPESLSPRQAPSRRCSPSHS